MCAKQTFVLACGPFSINLRIFVGCFEVFQASYYQSTVNLWGCPKTVKETVYKTLVRQKLQYACSAWDPHHQKDKAALEWAQRKAARFVTGNYDRTTNVTEMLTYTGTHLKR